MVERGGFHDLLETRVDDVDFFRALEVFHVGRGGGQLVAESFQNLQVPLFLVLLGHAAGRDVLDVLEPLEVRDSDTAAVCKHVRNDDDAAFHESLFSHKGSRAIGTFQDNAAVEGVRIVDRDRLLNCSGDQDVALLGEERERVEGFFFSRFGVADEGAVEEEVILALIDIKTLWVVDGRVVLNDGGDYAFLLLDEVACPVADGTETLDIERLAGDALRLQETL